MGQKVNPIGLRIGLIQDWRSRWFAAGPRYSEYLEEDIKIRKYLAKNLTRAGLSRIIIEREDKVLNIDIFTARPGIIIGKGGAEVDRLKTTVEKMVNRNVQISVLEVKRPELDANLVAQAVAEQLIGRVPFRRAMKRAVTAALKAGAKGVRISCSGRLGGAEMARREWYREGRVPLHTLRADISYGYVNARTTFGSIGVKVWIYNGDIIGRKPFAGLIEEKKPEPLGLVERKRRAPQDQAAKVGPAKDDVESKEEKKEAKSQAQVAIVEPSVKKEVKEEKIEEVLVKEEAKAKDIKKVDGVKTKEKSSTDIEAKKAEPKKTSDKKKELKPEEKTKEPKTKENKAKKETKTTAKKAAMDKKE